MGAKQIRACVSRYDQSAWTASYDDAQNDAHIASTGVWLYERTCRVATSKNETGNYWGIKKSAKSTKLK